MKKIILFFMAIILSVIAKADKLDTLYYDNDGKGMGSIVGATFYRITYTPDDPNFAKTFNEYYATGELKAKGRFITYDKYNDNNFVRDGDVEWYYKSGALMMKATYKSGHIINQAIKFSEDGTIKHEIFQDEGYFIVYKDGESYGKYNLENGKPFCIKPIESDIFNTINNNITYKTINKNGIKISVALDEIKDYGKYYQLHILLTNMTGSNIIFDTKNIITEVKSQSDWQTIKVYSLEEYAKKIDKKNAKKIWWYSANERTSANQAATVNAKVNTQENNSYNNNSKSYLNIDNSNSKTYGNVSTSSNSSGYNNTTTNISIENKATAYAAQQIASENIKEYNSALKRKKQELTDNYLKTCIVPQCTTIGGTINIEKKKSTEIKVSIIIDGQTYPFIFNIQ